VGKSETLFEHAYGIAVQSLGGVKIPQSPRCKTQAVGVIQGLCEANAFLSICQASFEIPALCEDHHQPAAGYDRWEELGAAMLTLQFAVEQHDSLLEMFYGAAKLAREEMRDATADTGIHSEWNVSELLADCLSSLGEPAGVSRGGCLPKMVAQVGGGPPEPMLIIEGRRRLLRIAEVARHPAKLGERPQGASQLEPQVDCLLQCLAALREVRQRDQRLLKALDGVPMG
jgi:hypothetical protein